MECVTKVSYLLFCLVAQSISQVAKGEIEHGSISFVGEPGIGPGTSFLSGTRSTIEPLTHEIYWESVLPLNYPPKQLQIIPEAGS